MKSCLGCGKPLPPRRNDGPKQEAARKYCDRGCANRATAAQRDFDERAALYAKAEAGDPVGCWLWRGATNGVYGHTARGSAHRRSYELSVGAIPPGLLVLHRCDTPLCVNPKHLFVGTQLDNLADAKVKGRRLGRPLKNNA